MNRVSPDSTTVKIASDDTQRAAKIGVRAEDAPLINLRSPKEDITADAPSCLLGGQ